ncbi:MAG: zinc-binding dehydrogenase [Deltaproteobacteria bacterium]|nr:zinc-binding dehydrogenase [Deltaproteobacteria bacterium]
MRAIAFRSHGAPEVLEDVDLDVPEHPPAGKVRVRVDAVALNHLDLWVRRGLPNLKLPLPHRLGADIAGTVEAIGEGAIAPPVGTKVVLAPAVSCGVCEACLRGRDNLCRRYHILGESTDGGYGEVLDVPASNVLGSPSPAASLSVPEVAAIPLTFLTAWQMVVEKARVERGETVLVHAAGSGVSVAAIQMCKMRGARVIATSTSAVKLERARTLGADETIDTTTQDFVAESRRLTGKRGVDVVVDHVGGETFAKSLLAAASGGRLVTCGATSGPTPTIDLRHVFFRQLEILGSTMGSKATMFPILREVERGALRPVVDRVLPFTAEGAREAHRVLEERGAFGKIVLAR